MPILDVPYYTQPTSTTCQASCLRMVGAFLDKKLGVSVTDRNPEAIKKTINTDPGRPEKKWKNHYENMKWWFENEYGTNFAFTRDSATDDAVANNLVTKVIDSGFPTLVSVNHSRVEGHVIVVIGYEDAVCGGDGVASGELGSTVYVCHDPYGQFNPELSSGLYGKHRWEGGYCPAEEAGERGPGAAVRLDIAGIKRIRSDQHSPNMFYFLYPSWNFSPAAGYSVPS